MLEELYRSYIESSNTFGIVYDFITITICLVLIIFLYKLSTKSKSKILLALMFTLLYIPAYAVDAIIAKAIYEPIALFWPVAIIVLFHDEISDVTKKLEFTHKKKKHGEDFSYVIRTIVSSVERLAKNKVGALIVVEGSQKLDSLIENAIMMDAVISEELVQTIFNTSTPLHDGAVIVRDGRLICAGVYFQPSENENISKQLGSRHRAAIGASELYDALILVVSEETGKISVARNAKLDRNVKKDELIKYLEEYV